MSPRSKDDPNEMFGLDNMLFWRIYLKDCVSRAHEVVNKVKNLNVKEIKEEIFD
jgi:hypothetical protein